jgi:hypothetical protein
MADRVRKVTYCHVTVPARVGQGAMVLGALREANVNLLAFSGFPIGGGKAQIDIVVDGMATVRRVARREGWRVSANKKAFLAQGVDRVGACHRHLAKLAAAKINATAATGIAAAGGRYGMLFWVKPKDYARAARALGAR